jgi:hypothetical protein
MKAVLIVSHCHIIKLVTAIVGKMSAKNIYDPIASISYYYYYHINQKIIDSFKSK